MKAHLPAILTIAIASLAAQTATAQATITGPSTWASGQPTTVTWTVTRPSTCASGVKVQVNLSNTSIQTGSMVPLSAGRSAIPGITVAAGTPVSLSLKDMCTGNVITPAFRVTMTGGTAAITPVAASTATVITAQIKQNIDSACQGVLGAACSSSASYNSTYTAITQKIIQGSLKSDSASIMYNYLIPMVSSSASWESNIVDNAWRSAGCSGAAPEAQWNPRVPQLQTFQAVVNAMKQQRCTTAAAITTPAAPAVQYVTAQSLSAANPQVWGALASFASMPTNCPAANGAVACSRAALAAYVKAHGTATLLTLAAPIYQQTVGQPLDAAHSQVLFYQFGNYWTGADDLAKYLQSTAANWKTLQVNQTATLAGLNSQGCLVNASGAKVVANETCGLYFLDSKGAHSPGVYPATFNGHMVILSSANPGGGILVNNSGTPLKILTTSAGWAIGVGIVAQGGGNIVAQGGGNIVAQGGGNIVAQGGGNIGTRRRQHRRSGRWQHRGSGRWQPDSRWCRLHEVRGDGSSQRRTSHKPDRCPRCLRDQQ
jgi:hypothetical protein